MDLVPSSLSEGQCQGGDYPGLDHQKGSGESRSPQKRGEMSLGKPVEEDSSKQKGTGHSALSRYFQEDLQTG